EDEVPSFAGADELISKVEATRTDGEERRRRALKARRRALAEHTWARRFPEPISGLTLEPQKKRDRSCFFAALVAGAASLVELERIGEAAAVLDGLEGATARAVAATLTLGDRPELAPLHEALARLLQKSA